jgi:hypothetical protein
MVEHQLPKLRVVGSIPIYRSKFSGRGRLRKTTFFLLRSGRAGLVTAPRLPLALEPPALCLPATGIHAPAKGRLCDDWYFFLQNPGFT